MWLWEKNWWDDMPGVFVSAVAMSHSHDLTPKCGREHLANDLGHMDQVVAYSRVTMGPRLCPGKSVA